MDHKAKPVVFIFDRVMHYHQELFKRLDTELPKHGYQLFLFSGKEKESTTGRVALKEKIVKNQFIFHLTEKSVLNFMIRYQHGLTKKIANLKPAVVVTMCHSGTLSEWNIMRLKKRLNFKLVAWQCGYEYNAGAIKQWALKKFVPNFDHHLAYHTNAKDYAIAHGARSDQITVMHNTINEATITCIGREDARNFVDERWPTVIGKKIVLYVGAVLKEKRLELVFEALDILNRTDVVFMLVGDGPYLGEIKRKYSHRHDFLSTGGIVKGVGPIFDAADVFVLPGTGGLAINEAMSHGVPIVSGYADGSADDLVIDGKNGFRFTDESAKELSTALHALLSDTEVASIMGEAGRNMILGEFSFDRFIERVVGVLVEKNFDRMRTNIAEKK